ncbi:MAG: tRNA-dihydrouridine synthase [Porticoccaceae bacterium]|nr:tRNA-dihydrouridine synthase [Porticoccaceae bacterium]MDP4744812.1 tRNA-dihydrouridine synthase [Porticoccaceae bacterium]MDP4753001.1 tRNA-dihydrouridine synthase [Porticoccaceae bacterium]MDP4890281.1 tRNA-dihydrouridine synthase [Porticoccaceae bacterium]
MNTEFLGKTLSGPFTIPSGIVTTATSIIQYMFDHMPQIGVITTKSVGLTPRAGYREPVYSQYAPGCFVNAVGLTNPGAEAAAEALAKLRIPEDRFLLTSIFGGSVEEFVEVAKIMAPVSNGLELNLSCPHAKGYGMAMGQDPELVREITAAVKAVVNIPVVPKLTPNTPNIGEIALAAVAGGADAICAINTVGPGYTAAHGQPVLSNGAGGMSGKGVLPIALKCVREIAAVTDCPIIGCGGVSSAADVREFMTAGASIVGVGSALTGMTTDEIGSYFNQLESDICFGSNKAENHIRYDIDMNFKPVTLVDNLRVCEDICVLTFDRKIDIQAGEFIFLWVPGLGEKPFSALSDDPFSLAVIDVGVFTHALMDLKVGTEVYVRGPHGIAAAPPEDAKIMAVAGGTGLAAVYQLARDFGNAEIFTGARTAERLYYLEECKKIADVHVATDDGSEGYKGFVTELLRNRLLEMSRAELDNLVFYNCGPSPMVHAAAKVQREFCRDDQIFSAIDYLTKCGVGICGACASPDGKRICVDGPFMQGSPERPAAN